MKFLDRTEEIKRLDKTLKSPNAGLIVIWGRRRIGKTRLLLEWIKKHKGIYWVSDESSVSVQKRYFAETLNVHFPGFSNADYSNWDSFFKQLIKEAKINQWKGPLVIDEFPYLVANSPELPSILQRLIDHDFQSTGITVVLSGSSQRMMQDLVMNYHAPLYGRASALFALDPLPIGYIGEALAIKSHRKMIEAYTLWGGVPRYWELAAPYRDNIIQSACDLILNPKGPLHQEPDRLLLEESPPAISLRPILDAIGMGSHKISEIAARLTQPATSLSRPIKRLQELGLVTKETPFGENEKSTKKTLYKINDPFFRLWFKVVAPKKSLLLETSSKAQAAIISQHFPSLISQTWEELCLKAVSSTQCLGDNITWLPAKRFWQGSNFEWDLVSQSLDEKYLLLGEVKWSQKPVDKRYLEKVLHSLQQKGLPLLKLPKNIQLKHVVFIPDLPKEKFDCPKNTHIIDAKMVTNYLV